MGEYTDLEQKMSARIRELEARIKELEAELAACLKSR